MEKIVNKYKDLKSLRKICIENEVDYSNFIKDKVPKEKRKKVIAGIKKEMCKIMKVVIDEYKTDTL